MRITVVLLAGAALAAASCAGAPPSTPASPAAGSALRPRHLVLVAGPKSHGPEGNGEHEYGASARLLKVMLDTSNVAERVRVTVHEGGWPEAPGALDDADAILVLSDGSDGDRYAEALHLESDARVRHWDGLLRRGVGFVVLHFSTFAPDARAGEVLRNVGAYFDWETDGRRQWHSRIRTVDAEVAPLAPAHPVLRGVEAFRLRDEFYFDLRFGEGDTRLTPLLAVPALGGRPPLGDVVAWARAREDGGRSFGATFGHAYDNWARPAFRKIVLNALAWAAGVEVPPGGVEARHFDRDEVRAALAGVRGSARARPEPPIRALVVTGDDGPFHPWAEKTEVLRRALEQDGRFRVEVTEDVEELGRRRLPDYDVLVLNYCNWHAPAGLGPAARRAFTDYLRGGGGVTIVHFSNGAWHWSLPNAPASDWPEYRKIAARVWEHGRSGHDRYRTFPVAIASAAHEITAGMAPWRARDELYHGQVGDVPIEVLVTAVSEVTRRPEPLAWTSAYEGKGRVFQTVLGHDAASLSVGGTAELVRRGTVWAAGRAQRDIARADVVRESALAADEVGTTP